MSSNRLFTFTVVITMIAIACYAFTTRTIHGEGDVVKKKFDISGFEQIALEFNADVFYSQSDETSVEVETNENFFEHLDISTSKNKLTLDTKEDVELRSSDGIKIYVSSPNLSALAVNGSGCIHIDKAVKISDLSCEINGSGEIIAKDIQAKKSSFDVNGSGEIVVEEWTGTAYDIDINGSGEVALKSGSSSEGNVAISGSGDVDTKGIKCKTAKVDVSGSGDVVISASDILNVDVNGSGDVTYTGNPKLNMHISGSGDVNRLN